MYSRFHGIKHDILEKSINNDKSKWLFTLLNNKVKPETKTKFKSARKGGKLKQNKAKC